MPDAANDNLPRVKWWMALLIFISSLIAWFLQFILSLTLIGELVSWFIGVIAGGTFFMWFYFLHIGYLKKNPMVKVVIVILAAGIEFIPFLNDFPADVLEVVALVVVSRIEDAKTVKDSKEAAKKQGMGQKERYARMRSVVNQQQLRAKAANDNAQHAAANDNAQEEEPAIAA